MNLAVQTTPQSVERRDLVSRSAVALLLATLSCWFVLILKQTVSRISGLFTSLPLGDYWRVPQMLSRYQAHDLSVLWTQHNEHRIIFPELVFIFDALFLHMQLVLPVIVSGLLFFAINAALCWSWRYTVTVPWHFKLAACLLSGIAMLWQGCAFALALPFLLQWPAVQLAVVLATMLIYQLRIKPGNLVLAGVIVFGWIGTFSSGNGLLAWPLFVFLALLIRLPGKYVIAIATAGVAAIACFFIGYRSSSSLNVLLMLSHPWVTLRFIGAYLAAPYSGYGTGLLILLCAMLSVAISFHRTRRSLVLMDRLVFVTCAWILYAALSALITAAGRLELRDTHVIAATAIRYTTVPLATWAAFLLLMSRVSSLRLPIRASYAVLALLGIWLELRQLHLKPWLLGNSNTHAEAQLASVAFAGDINDPDLFKSSVFPDLNGLKLWGDPLRSQKLSVFENNRWSSAGTSLKNFAPMHPGIVGEIASIEPIAGGYRVTGWADDSLIRKPFSEVVLAGGDGRLIGFGRRFPFAFPPSVMNSRIPNGLGWAGYLPESASGENIHAYVVDRRHFGLLPIDGLLRVPLMRFFHGDLKSKPLDDITWSRDVTGGRDHMFPTVAVDFGKRPATEIYSTFAGSDANVGTLLSSEFDTPPDHCLIVPILNGPVTLGLTAQILASNQLNPLSVLPLDGSQRWRLWEVKIPPGITRIKISAEDNGRGWGQWIATGTPFGCS